MNKEIQILYAKLTQDDRDKVDAKIRELFAKQQDLLATESCSNVQLQENCYLKQSQIHRKAPGGDKPPGAFIG